MKNAFYNSMMSIFYFIFGTILLAIGYFSYSLLGIKFALISSFFTLIGLILIVRLYQIWFNQKLYSHSIKIIKNWWRFLLLIVLAIPSFYGALFDIMEYFVFDGRDTAVMAGRSTFLIIDSAITVYLIKGLFKKS